MAGKYKLDWTDLAFEALEDIHDFITKQAQSEVPDKKVVKKIFKSTEILKTNPTSFQEEPFLKEKAKLFISLKVKPLLLLTYSTPTSIHLKSTSRFII